jgi:hypothetical protein
MMKSILLLAITLPLAACLPPPHHHRVEARITPTPDVAPTTAGPALQQQAIPPSQMIPGQLTVSRVGGREREWREARFFRGNIYQATHSTTITEFQAFLALPEQGCSLGFHAFMSQSPAGPYTPVWSTQRLSAGVGYHTSGSTQIQTIPGLYYVLGVGWDCQAGYYSGEYGRADGQSLGFGVFAGNAWSNGYPGYTHNFSPTNSQLAEAANYDQVISFIP